MKKNVWILKSRKPQDRDGRMTIVFLLLFILLTHLQFNEKSTLGRNIKFLCYTPDKLLYLEEQDKVSLLPRSLPLCYYPFFLLPLPINRADKELLMTIKGVGPSLAETIVQHRQKTDVISNADDLRKIPGIGGKRAAALVNELTFDKAE